MRLFFAYWPSAETAQALMDWVRRAHALYGGRMMRSDTLHLTLAFLGQTEPERAQQLAAECAHWRLPAGSMVLNEPGRFNRAKVVWLGPSHAQPASLAWLYAANQQLWSNLASLGWTPEPGFRPHVSLLRNAQAGDLSSLQGPAIAWSPERCVLVSSSPGSAGSNYTILAEIPLDRCNAPG